MPLILQELLPGRQAAFGVRSGSGAQQEAVDIPGSDTAVAGLAKFWSGARDRMDSRERELAADQEVAICGAGVYGNFILCCRIDTSAVREGRLSVIRPILGLMALAC
ncbi:MAG: hypothetical protein RIA09_01525 [Hoeflea sp.]|uniref:hypothetical protein n=1 Tax=Hoeflea sp. TaxID=1940281 RepID=UPI0032EF8D7E